MQAGEKMVSGGDLLLDFVYTLIKTLFADTLVGSAMDVLEEVRDQVVSLFTGEILGIPGPFWAFFIILCIGAQVAINNWQKS